MKDRTPRITQAVILSAGFGTRLHPLTEKVPKTMVPLAGKPLLEHHLEQLKKYGVRELFINLHYLPNMVIKYFRNKRRRRGVSIRYSLEAKLLGTAGGIKKFEPWLKQDFFVIYGDIFSRANYGKMARAYFKKKDAIGMEIVGKTKHPEDSDLVEVDGSLKFLKIHPKPHRKLPRRYKAMRAMFIFNKKILRYIPANRYFEIDHELLPKIIAQQEPFYGYETADYLKDIGTMERYRQVQRHVSRKLSK